MKTYKELVDKLFDIIIEKDRENLSKKEFISRQLKLHDIRLKLLAFLGRKEGNFIIVYSKEGIELTMNGHSSKTYKCEISEDLETVKWRS